MPESADLQLDAAATYAIREKSWTVSRDAEGRRSGTVARLRLVSFLAAALALVWWLGFAGGLPAFAVAAVLLVAFAGLVIRHARIDARFRHFDALRVVNQRGRARVAREWNALPGAPSPPGLEVDEHPYAIDLDLFGHASVFQLTGPAATPHGTDVLAAWLLRPADAATVRRRQEAVAELAPMAEWRERLAALGVEEGHSNWNGFEQFLDWAGGPAPSLRRLEILRPAVYLITASLWLLLALHFSRVAPNSLWPIPLVLGMILSFATAGSVSRAFDRAGSGERALERHAGIFSHIDAQELRSSLLTAVKDRLAANGRSAPRAMHALGRILAFAELRRGAALLHFPIQAFTLWDFHCVFALERWRTAAGAHVRDWFDAAGEIDALACLATLAHENADWRFPEFTSDPRVAARALGHPLIAAGRRVTNDVELGPPGTVLLVTGSNMSGKSTLLRSIGVNIVLAQAGAPVCAAAMQLPRCDLQTSIRIQDSLERGVSYFMAALARLKRVVDAAEREPGDRVLLYLLDEILQGTNSAERGIAVQAVARHLLASRAIGVMTTHDLNLAGEQPLRSAARLVHFTETVDADGTMRFDYRLREGLATSRNALRLMQLIGISLPRA